MIRFDLMISSDRWSTVNDLEVLLQNAFDAVDSFVDTDGEVSLLLTHNADMQRLNEQFRNKDKPTDVLSFPADAMDAPLLGDIAIGFETSAADAEKMGKTLPDHLSHLVIHGCLHLLGYDHVNEQDAEEMEALERRALASIGIADPYSVA